MSLSFVNSRLLAQTSLITVVKPLDSEFLKHIKNAYNNLLICKKLSLFWSDFDSTAETKYYYRRISL